jgi:hypothetical protein
MDLVTLGVVLIIAALAVVMIRRGFPRSRAEAEPQRHPFAAVELIPGAGSCAAAKKLAGNRMLVAEAPVLPLDECGRRCRCSYKWYADRRQINRRRIDDGFPEQLVYQGSENRVRTDRRKPVSA